MPTKHNDLDLDEYTVISHITRNVLGHATMYQVEPKTMDDNENYIITFDNDSINKLEHAYASIVDVLGPDDWNLQYLLIYFDILLWRQWFNNWYMNEIMNHQATIKDDLMKLNHQLDHFENILYQAKMIDDKHHYSKYTLPNNFNISNMETIFIINSHINKDYNYMLKHHEHLSNQYYQSLYYGNKFNVDCQYACEMDVSIYETEMAFDENTQNEWWFDKNDDVFTKFNQHFSCIISGYPDKMTLF